MQFNHTYEVAMPSQRLWYILIDVHKVAECLEGVEELNVLDDDRYEGRMQVKMGPVKLNFEGNVHVTLRDHDQQVGTLEATARDPKAGGGFKATLNMQLAPQAPECTTLQLDLDTTFLGRIGELGRPLIKKKINTMMDDFVEALSARYIQPTGEIE